MELPKQIVESNMVNPKVMVIFSKPKTGKTTAFAGLNNNLIIDLEEGSNYVSALKVKIKNLNELRELIGKVLKEGRPYKFATLDTVTALENLIKPLAVELYQKTPMGKNFVGDDITILPNGAGYNYVREAFLSVLEGVKMIAPYTILSGHIKDKRINDTGELVEPSNIELTGKLKSIVCANADAIGFMFRKNNENILSFKTKDDVICGARSKHLRNAEIVISREEDGEIKTFWDKVYLNENV